LPLPAISLRNVGRMFGPQWALAHLDLRVEEGEVTLIAGPNGSGKSTLLGLCAGLLPPSVGEIELASGGDRLLQRGARSHPAARFAWRRRVAMLSHSSHLYESLTARETVKLWCDLLGRPASRADIAQRLAEVGLESEGDRTVGGFSAGMQKRLAFARVRLIDAPVVLLDEPFSALDFAGTQLVSRWIAGDRAQGKTVLLTSHDLERAAPVADRAVLLTRGQKVWEGSAADLQASADPYLRQFLFMTLPPW
jgi:heme exporter protein A